MSLVLKNLLGIVHYVEELRIQLGIQRNTRTREVLVVNVTPSLSYSNPQHDSIYQSRNNSTPHNTLLPQR
jgi:hypothetical protein